MILAGDIGGTKTALCTYRKDANGLIPLRGEIYNSKDYPKFEQILDHFWAGEDRISTICLGVAGPIIEGRCKTINLPWLLDERKLSDQFSVKRVKLLNDLQAAAYGMLFLSDKERMVLNKGVPRKGNIGVLVAGTGLGEAFLYWDGERYRPVASEGGHTDFASRSDQEMGLCQFLRSEFGRVSYERVLSGNGFFNIYRFLKSAGFAAEPAWLRDKIEGAPDPSVVITTVGLAGGHPLCVETLNIFAEIYGAEAGNLALKTFAIGGIYVGGGIVLSILNILKGGRFMEGFLAKGRYQEMMSEIPVKVALNVKAPLMGAAHYAAELEQIICSL